MKRSLLFILIAFWGLTPKTQTVGVISYTNPLDSGYILFAPTSNKDVFLIDACGYKVNEWKMPTVPGMLGKLNQKGELIYAQRQSSPIFNAGGVGGRIVAQDWEGELLWNLALNTPVFHQHHDIEILPNGNFIALGWEYHTSEEAIAAGRENVATEGLWSETIREYNVDEDGTATLVWEWRSWNHLIQDKVPDKPNYGIIDQNPGKININFTPNSSTAADWMHANSLDYNPNLDQIIINLRNFAEFWIIDHSTTTEEATSNEGGLSGKGGQILYRWGNPQSYQLGGPVDRKFYGQHDVRWIADDLPGAGQIMIFNNGIGRPDGNYSTVEIIEPPLDGYNYSFDESAYAPSNSTITYGNMTDQFFFASRVSGAQRLPNGHTLICNGVRGQIFEVDQEKQIVWEYANPSGSTITEQGDDPGLSNQLFQAVKYYPAFEGFIGKDLVPTEKIEINPSDNCELLSSSVSTPAVQSSIKFNSLVENTLFLQQEKSEELAITIYNTAGSLVYSSTRSGRIISIDLPIVAGIYFMGLSPKGESPTIYKIVKTHD